MKTIIYLKLKFKCKTPTKKEVVIVLISKMSSKDEQEICRQLIMLARCRKAIVADLDVYDIIPDLLSKFVISHADKQRIDHEVSLIIMVKL